VTVSELNGHADTLLALYVSIHAARKKWPPAAM
jgi:hypothetical protein